MAIERYDPLAAPDAAAWLEMDEGERLELVLDCHNAADVEVPTVAVHAALHVIVENQIALGDEPPVRRKAQQLMAQGLDRHGDPTRRYYSALNRLNARKWLRSF